MAAIPVGMEKNTKRNAPKTITRTTFLQQALFHELSVVCNFVQCRKRLPHEFIDQGENLTMDYNLQGKTVLLTFHGIFKEEVINVADGFPIRAQVA